MNEARKYIQENALAVIEKFGGIRPMATKLGVAVTTIQGWKKRENIPDSRIDDVLKIAHQNGIEIITPVVEERPDIEAAIAQIKAKIEEPVKQDLPDEDMMEFPVEDSAPPPKHFGKAHEIKPADILKMESTIPNKEAENKNVSTKSTEKKVASGGWVLPMLMGASLVGLIAVFWPVREDVQAQKQRLGELESTLVTLKEEQTSLIDALRDYIPDDVKAELQKIREQSSAIGEQAKVLADQTQKIATTYLGSENAAALQAYLSALKTQIGSLVSPTQTESILGRFTQLGVTSEGQDQLERSYAQLRGIIGSLEGRMDLLGDAMIVARENSTVLGETFEGIADEDLKAGALLLGLTQFRSALNRDHAPFKEDLALLYSMIGDDNPELRAALDELAPQAESGVLTVSGLSDEFRALAGDIAVNSLKGEPVTVGEQAKARLSQVLQIKKDGETILGADNKEKIEDVQAQLDNGDLRGALSSLSSLPQEEQSRLMPFIEKIESTLAAQDVSTAITSLLNTAKGEITGVKPINLNIKPSKPSDENKSQSVVKVEEENAVIDLTVPVQEQKINNNFRELNITPRE
jgi:hypothetical protein